MILDRWTSYRYQILKCDQHRQSSSGLILIRTWMVIVLMVPMLSFECVAIPLGGRQLLGVCPKGYYYDGIDNRCVSCDLICQPEQSRDFCLNNCPDSRPSIPSTSTKHIADTQSTSPSDVALPTSTSSNDLDLGHQGIPGDLVNIIVMTCALITGVVVLCLAVGAIVCCCLHRRTDSKHTASQSQQPLIISNDSLSSCQSKTAAATACNDSVCPTLPSLRSDEPLKSHEHEYQSLTVTPNGSSTRHCVQTEFERKSEQSTPLVHV